MNKFDERYVIRLGRYSDIENVMFFLKKYWGKEHIMANDRMLFEYEYVEENHLNFMLAIDKETNQIEALYGFLKSSKDKSKTDIWGSIWKVNTEGHNLHFLGVELINRLKDFVDYRYRFGIGANPITSVSINQRLLNRKINKLEHHYILNDSITDFQLANIKEKKVKGYSDKLITKMIQYNDFEELKRNFDIKTVDQIPHKDDWYFEKRFFNHPYYQYYIYGIYEKKSNIEAIMVTREVQYNKSKALRIIDYIGNQRMIGGLGEIFNQLLVKNHYEYIDLYVFGYDNAYLKEAGFIKKDESDINIIPNYFEPFVQENINIWIHYDVENAMFFKGDGDQDRPNQQRR